MNPDVGTTSPRWWLADGMAMKGGGAEAARSQRFGTNLCRGRWRRSYQRHVGLVPRFYFHLASGAEFAEDEEDLDLRTFAAARGVAVDSLRSVMADDILKGDLNTASFIEIEDHQHLLLETITFEQVVHLRKEAPPGRSTSGARPSRRD